MLNHEQMLKPQGSKEITKRNCQGTWSYLSVGGKCKEAGQSVQNDDTAY